MLQAVPKLIRIFSSFFALVAVSATAGVLTLTNGDRVHGELVVVEREHVVWLSENFGKVNIDKAKILSLDTDVELKIAGRDEPCTLAGHRRQQWELYCTEGSGWVMDFPAIDRAEPYINFIGNPVIYHGKVAAAGAFEQGNREREDWDLNASFDIRNGDLHHLFSALYQKQISTELKRLEKYQLKYDLRWVFAEKWFAAGNSALLREEASNLGLGTTLGLGLGYLFYDTDKTAFSTQGGISSVSEVFIDSALSQKQDKRYAAGRAAVSYRYKFSLGPEIYFDQEILQSMNRGNDYKSSAKFGVSTPLAEGILMDVNYLWLYDNAPSLESKKEDTKLSIGVGYAW